MKLFIELFGKNRNCLYLCNVLMKNHCIPYFGGKEITKTKYYMMKYYNKYVSMLFAVLLVSSAWAAEVSDSLKTLNTIG